MSEARRANILGLGLIGGSIGVGLRERGWQVSGDDANASRVSSALERGIIDRAGLDPEAEITKIGRAHV